MPNSEVGGGAETMQHTEALPLPLTNTNEKAKNVLYAGGQAHSPVDVNFYKLVTIFLEQVLQSVACPCSVDRDRPKIFARHDG